MLRNQRVHASLLTADLARARDFYERLLGFTPRAVQPGLIQFGPASS